MVFIETSLFTKLLDNYLTPEEYRGLQVFLLERPDAGAIIQGSGGVRKLRWKGAGRGKRGGTRIIYYWQASAGEIWLLTLYGKNERESIPTHILRQIAEEIRHV